MQKLLISFFVVLCCGFIFAALLFFQDNSSNLVQAAESTATCQTGFDRPLLFGVGPDGSAGAYESQLKNAGSTISTIGLTWDTIQPNGPQDYDPAAVNFPIEKASRDGLVVAVNMSGTPEWARGQTTLPTWKSQPREGDPTVEREFREFVRQAVRDNKNRAKYWSYWNEPNGCMSNHHTGECGWNGDTASDFAHWHKIFYEEVKKEDPSAKVILGNLELIKPDYGYIKEMNNKDVKYDYLGLNVYNKGGNYAFPLDWVKGAYNAQKDKKPVWLNEWGWDQQWGMSKEQIADRIKQTFPEFIKPENSYIHAAIYHNLRDRDGDYGLWEKKGDVLVPRVNGQAFLDISKSACNPQFSNAPVTPADPGGPTPPTTPLPGGAGGSNITVRTHFTATPLTGDGDNWPKVSLLVNNGAGFNASNPSDDQPCDGTVTGTTAKCGSLNRFPEKLVEDFEVAGATFTKDIVIPSSRLVLDLGDGVGITKLSYAFHNDLWKPSEGDRNAFVTKVEFFGPDGKMILSYSPEKSAKGYSVTPTPNNDRALESFYFDMGIINNTGAQDASQNGMVKAFDKLELKNKETTADKWDLSKEGSFNIISTRVHQAIVQNYGTTTPAACVVASADTGGTLVKRGQPVTLTSVATVPIKTFRYSFYNLNNKNPDGSPKAYCIPGAPPQPGDGCPTGSGQLVIESTGDNEGTIQGVDWFKFPNNQVTQSFWKGDIGSNRQVPFDANFGGTTATAWNFSNYINGLAIGGPFNPAAEVDAIATYNTNNQNATMEIWRNNQLWYNIVPFTANGSNLDWGQAEGWTLYKDFNLEPTAWPGTGLVTARSSFVGKDSKLWHIYWRGNEEWTRGVPIVNGNPNSALLDNQPNKGFIRTRTINDLKSTGKVQAISHLVMPDGNVQEQIWQNNQVWRRTITLTPDSPNFATASPLEGPLPVGLTPRTDKSASETLEYNRIHQIDAATGVVPETLQVNATFVTDATTPIGNDSKCVTWFTFDKALDGDVDGNCGVDIYDYNLLMENYGTTNCQYNLAGDCTINMEDINYLRQQYGQKCQ